MKNRVESLEQIAIFLKSDLFIPTTSPSVLAAIVDPAFDHFGSQNVDLSILSHEVYSMVQSARMAPELEPQLIELCSKVLANLAADGPWCEIIRMRLALEGFEDHLKKNVASGVGKSNFSTASDGEPKSVKGVLSVIEEMSDLSAHVRRSARERDLSYYCHARLEEPAAALEKLVVSEHRKTTSRRLVKIDRATVPEKKRPPISLRTRLRRLFSPYFMLRSFGSRILRYVKDRQSEGGIRTAFR